MSASYVITNAGEICTTGMKISICVAINRRLMRICSQYIRLLRSTFRGDRISVQIVFFYKQCKLLKASKMKKRIIIEGDFAFICARKIFFYR